MSRPLPVVARYMSPCHRTKWVRVQTPCAVPMGTNHMLLWLLESLTLLGAPAVIARIWQLVEGIRTASHSIGACARNMWVMFSSALETGKLHKKSQRSKKTNHVKLERWNEECRMMQSPAIHLWNTIEKFEFHAEDGYDNRAKLHQSRLHRDSTASRTFWIQLTGEYHCLLY